MSRIMTVLVLTALATFAIAQQPATDDPIVATINGEVITRSKLDMLYMNMNGQMRAQYDAAGGKMAFLDNYIAKRLMLQEAAKSAFEKRPSVQAAIDTAKESAVFDRYVREVVAGAIVTEEMMRSFYDENKAKFALPAAVKAYHILITDNHRTPEEAAALIRRVQAELKAQQPSEWTPATRQAFRKRFTDAARQWSEDGSAEAGGALGWIAKGNLDPKFEEVAFSIEPGVMSEPVQSKFGHHLIVVEDRRPAGFRPFEQVVPDIRELLVGQRSNDIMAAVKRITDELRKNGKVSIYRENID
jgi:peptidyl-prolyl cis-trans isomerase C